MSELSSPPAKQETIDGEFQTWSEFIVSAYGLINHVKELRSKRGDRRKYLEEVLVKDAPRSGGEQRYFFKETEDGFFIRVVSEENLKIAVNPKTKRREVMGGEVEVSELLGVRDYDGRYFDYVVKVAKQGVGNPDGCEVKLLFNAVPPRVELPIEQTINSQEGLKLPAQGGGQNFAEGLYGILQKVINR